MEGTLDEHAAAKQLIAWGLSPTVWEEKRLAKHIFTHVEWHMSGYCLQVKGDADFIWMDAHQLTKHAVPSAFARFYHQALSRLQETEESK